MVACSLVNHKNQTQTTKSTRQDADPQPDLRLTIKRTAKQRTGQEANRNNHKRFAKTQWKKPTVLQQTQKLAANELVATQKSETRDLRCCHDDNKKTHIGPVHSEDGAITMPEEQNKKKLTSKTTTTHKQKGKVNGRQFFWPVTCAFRQAIHWDFSITLQSQPCTRELIRGQLSMRDRIKHRHTRDLWAKEATQHNAESRKSSVNTFKQDSLCSFLWKLLRVSWLGWCSWTN